MSKKRTENKTLVSNNEKKSDVEEVVYFFDADFIGSHRELGKVLANGFLEVMPQLPSIKKKIIFVNTGVKLTTEGSYVLEPLKRLEDLGAEMLICGTCLEFFKVIDKVKVGRVSNALEIVETLSRARKVVKF